MSTEPTADRPAWTQETPTEPGYYWYRPSPVDNPATHVDRTSRVVWLYQSPYGPRLEVATFKRTGDKLADMLHGDWSGPLTPPEG